jgi:hypothetical protein
LRKTRFCFVKPFLHTNCSSSFLQNLPMYQGSF